MTNPIQSLMNTPDQSVTRYQTIARSTVKTFLMATTIAMLVPVAESRAVTLITPDGATASSQLNFPADKRLAVDTINGNGMVGGSHTNANYTDPAPGAGQDIYWLSSSYTPGSEWISFSFNFPQTLEGMQVWNYSEWTDLSRGVKTTDIRFFNGATLLQVLPAFSLLQAPGGSYTAPPTYAGEYYSFGGNIAGVTRVEFTNLVNWKGSGTGGGDLVGLSEVRFAVVPEPGSAMLILSSLGVVMAGRRNRRRGAAGPA